MLAGDEPTLAAAALMVAGDEPMLTTAEPMLADFFVSPHLLPAATSATAGGAAAGGGRRVRTAVWTPESLRRVVEALGAAEGDLAALPAADLAAAWGSTVEAFLAPSSPERREIEAPLAERCRLSPPGLAAALEAVLGGVRHAHAEEVFRRAADHLRRGAPPGAARPSGLTSPEGQALPDLQTLAGPAGLARRSGASAGECSPSDMAARAGSEGAGSGPAPSPPPSGGPVLVVLASNLPALAVQPLLPILAARRPVLLKSPSAEPLFAPAFLAALVRREPRLAGAVAAATWPGGAIDLEVPVLAGCSTVLAYGGEDALADLARRAPGKVVGYGPKASLAVVGQESMTGWGTATGAATVELNRVAAGLARDVALFDQRGCLSVAAVYVVGPLERSVALARRLAAELEELARRWPPGPAGAGEIAAVQQLGLEAEMRGLEVFPARARVAPANGGPKEAASVSIAAGTVVVEPEPAFRPSPGLRTVRVHPLPDLAALVSLLSPWRGRLQGAALAGAAAWGLEDDLRHLGLSRFAFPGELQSPAASWHNGGIDPLAMFLPVQPPTD